MMQKKYVRKEEGAGRVLENKKSFTQLLLDQGVSGRG